MKTAIKSFMLTLCVSIPIFAYTQITINVSPGNSIQTAINMASKGDTILVAPGNYTENLSIIGKTLVIGSHYLTTGDTSFISTTIIEGGAGNTINFKNNSKAILTGFTITKTASTPFLSRNIYIYGASPIIQKNIIKNGRAAGTNNTGPYGYPNQWGGAIFIEKGAPVIADNQIQNNSARTRGGGISIRNATPLITGNTIIHNEADENGGGIFCYESDAVIKRNIIDGNTTGWQVGGAGILCENSYDIIENNTIVNNVTNLNCCQSSGGGIRAVNALLEIRNNIIFKNTANSIAGISCSGPNFPIVEFNNVDSNFSVISGAYLNYSCMYDTTSSISTDPLFADFDNGDYRLTANSPCIDMGNPNSVYNDQEDPSVQGMALPPAWGSVTNDIGAFGGTAYAPDYDRDGLTDEAEMNLIPPSNPSCPDTDGDGVLDGEEMTLYGTSPTDDDSDNDNFKDGFEIEMCTDPLDSSSFPEVEKNMNYEILKQEAWLIAQQAYDSLPIIAVQELDPPIRAGVQTLGMVFQEGLAIAIPNNFLDTLSTYCLGRPRAGLDRNKVKIYTDKEGDGSFNLRSYPELQADYSSAIICPPIDTELLPIAGKSLVKLLVGHQHPITGDFPQMFDFGGTGYARFSEYDGLFGASYRVATRNVFDGTEDFPEFREFYYSILDTSRSVLLGKVEAKGFTAALEYTLIPGFTTDVKVRATFFPRIQLDSEELGIVGYSSMFWKGQDSTITISNDEAHDSDWLVVGFDQNDDGIVDQIVEHEIINPDEATQLVVTNFDGMASGQQIYFALENRDREESNYTEYADAEYHLRSSYSIQILKSNTPLTLKLYENHTTSEFEDNIAMEVVVKDMSLSPLDTIDVEYITRAYNPIDSDGDDLTDQLERLIGTCIDEEDTDGDSTSDYVELLNGTNPRANINSSSDELMAGLFVCETVIDTFFFSSASDCLSGLPIFAIALDSDSLFSIIDTIGDFSECPYLLSEGGSFGVVIKFSATEPNVYSNVLTVTLTDTIFQIPLLVNVERLPVTINALPDVCENEGSFLLSGGSPIGGNYSGIGVDANNNFSPSEAGVGTFEITYTYTNSSTGCSDFAMSTISVNPLPTAEISGILEFCEGESTVLMASGGISYAWSTGETTATITVNAPGNYTVTVTDEKGCVDTESVITIVDSLPLVDLMLQDTFCIKETALELTGGTPVGGNYSGTGVADNIFNPMEAGIGIHLITYTYQDPITECIDSASQDIVIIGGDCLTGVNSIKVEESVTVFPNPSNGSFSIHFEDWSGKKMVQVFDIRGHQILTRESISDQIEINGIPRGIFVLKLSNGTLFTTRKLIIQ